MAIRQAASRQGAAAQAAAWVFGLVMMATQAGAEYVELDGIVAVVDDDVVLASELLSRVKRIREQSERKVSEVMQPIVTTLEFDDPLMKALSEFIGHDLALAPVLRKGKVVGIVNTLCVAHELAQHIL